MVPVLPIRFLTEVYLLSLRRFQPGLNLLVSHSWVFFKSIYKTKALTLVTQSKTELESFMKW